MIRLLGTSKMKYAEKKDRRGQAILLLADPRVAEHAKLCHSDVGAVEVVDDEEQTKERDQPTDDAGDNAIAIDAGIVIEARRRRG